MLGCYRSSAALQSSGIPKGWGRGMLRGHRVAPHLLTLSPSSSCRLTPVVEAALGGHPQQQAATQLSAAFWEDPQ